MWVIPNRRANAATCGDPPIAGGGHAQLPRFQQIGHLLVCALLRSELRLVQQPDEPIHVTRNRVAYLHATILNAAKGDFAGYTKAGRISHRRRKSHPGRVSTAFDVRRTIVVFRSPR
jgi:hypothetical protein